MSFFMVFVVSFPGISIADADDGVGRVRSWSEGMER